MMQCVFYLFIMRTNIIITLVLLLVVLVFLNVCTLFKLADIHTQAQDIHEHVEGFPTDSDYQISINVDGVSLFDRDRYIGYLPFDKDEKLHQLIMRDSQ